MPTITVSDHTAPVSTVAPTTATQGVQNTRDRFMANLAKIEAASQAQNTPEQANTQSAENHAPNANDINKVEGEKTTTPAPSDLDERIASMARKEKAAWQQVKALKAEKEALAKAQEGRMTKDEFVATLRQDPSKLGLSAEELAQVYINQNTPVDPTIQALRSELAAIRAEQEAFKKSQEDNVASSYQQALKSIDSEARALIDKDDAYEVTRSQGAHAAVTKFIELTYHETGELMDTKEAAAAVEAELERQAVDLYNKSNKLKAKIRPPQEAPQQPATKQPNQMQTQTKTLTHGMSQASSNNNLSRRDRAIAAFQGRLK